MTSTAKLRAGFWGLVILTLIGLSMTTNRPPVDDGLGTHAPDGLRRNLFRGVLPAVHAQQSVGPSGPTSNSGGTFTGGTVPGATTFESDVTLEGNLALDGSNIDVQSGGNIEIDSGSLQIGTGGGLVIYQDAAGTPDQTGLWVGALTRHLLLAEEADIGFDFAHAQTTNPTLFIHSANQSTTQWLGLTHDATDGVISVGTGSVQFGADAATATAYEIKAGDSTGSGNAGADLSVSAGDGTVGNAAAGTLKLFSGTRAGSGTAGVIQLLAPAVPADDANGHNAVRWMPGGTNVRWALGTTSGGLYGMSLASAALMGWSNGAAGMTGNDTQFARVSAGVVRLADDTTAAIRSLLGGGAAVASDTALPVPTGRVFHVTGTNNIDSITSTNFESGVCITMIFDGVLTVGDGNNLKLSAAFVTTADDTLSLCYDGSNWFETGRSVN